MRLKLWNERFFADKINQLEETITSGEIQ